MPADVKTSLPEKEWESGETITVTVDDPGAVVTALVVYVSQQGAAGPPVALPAALVYAPTGSV